MQSSHPPLTLFRCVAMAHILFLKLTLANVGMAPASIVLTTPHIWWLQVVSLIGQVNVRRVILFRCHESACRQFIPLRFGVGNLYLSHREGLKPCMRTSLRPGAVIHWNSR